MASDKLLVNVGLYEFDPMHIVHLRNYLFNLVSVCNRLLEVSRRENIWRKCSLSYSGRYLI